MAALGVAVAVAGASYTASNSLAARNPVSAAAVAAPQAPANLRAFTGGSDIALLWDVSLSATSIKTYNVYRNGRLVAQVTPSNDSTYLTANGTRYTDINVRAGTKYTYQVSATNTGGATSGLSAVLAVTQPSSTTAVPKITVDTSAATDLATTMAKAKAVLQTWYPKLADRLARPDYAAPSSFTLKADPGYGGVAYTSGTTITVGASYLRSNPTDMGMFVHEATHVLQQYSSSNNPPFIVEGIADWTRENMYNDRNPSVPGANAIYNDGYGTSAYFLQWITSTYKAPAFVHALNVSAHNNQSYAAVVSKYTGKTVGQLWTQLSGQTVSSLGPVKGIASRCLDLSYYNTNNGNSIQLLDCSGNTAQQWLTAAQTAAANGSVSLRVLGKCMDVQYSGTATGTPVWIWDCNGSSAQQWVPQANGSLLNVNSAKCLQTKAGASANGTLLEIAECNGSAAQKWVMPPQ